MSVVPAQGATISKVTHHRLDHAGGAIHYVSAGSAGPPIVLLHGFPETWWTFHKVIPILAETRRVIAVDLPGFGDSGDAEALLGSGHAADAVHELISRLGHGPVHLTAQDISGATAFRLAATHPDDILSLTAIETAIPGFGWEALADLAHGGAWQIGVLAAPGIPEMLLAGREREFIGGFAFPAMTAVAGSVSERDVDEFVRSYSSPAGFRGAAGLYRSLLTEGADLQALAGSSPVAAPVLAVGAGGGEFTHRSLSRATPGRVRSVLLAGVGHYAALEAPERLAAAILEFVDEIDSRH